MSCSTGWLWQFGRQTALRWPPLKLQQNRPASRQQQRCPHSSHQAQIVTAHRPGKWYILPFVLSSRPIFSSHQLTDPWTIGTIWSSIFSARSIAQPSSFDCESNWICNDESHIYRWFFSFVYVKVSMLKRKSIDYSGSILVFSCIEWVFEIG